VAGDPRVTTGIAVGEIMATRRGYSSVFKQRPSARASLSAPALVGRPLGGRQSRDHAVSTWVFGDHRVVRGWRETGAGLDRGDAWRDGGGAVCGWQQSLGIATVGSKFGSGAIPAGLPSLIWPAFDWSMVRDLIGPATAIAVLGRSNPYYQRWWRMV